HTHAGHPLGRTATDPHRWGGGETGPAAPDAHADRRGGCRRARAAAQQRLTSAQLVAYPLRMSQRPLSFDVERHNTTEVVLAVAGEIDLGTAPELEKVSLSLLDERPRSLVLDLSEVPFCDSSGIGVLVRLYNRATSIGCRVTVRRPAPNVRAVLEMT